MIKKKKTKSKYKDGDMVWLTLSPGDCQYIEGRPTNEKDWLGPFLIFETLHEEKLLRNGDTYHNNIDIPSILFEDPPQWYYSLVTDIPGIGIPIREDYLVSFNRSNKKCQS